MLPNPDFAGSRMLTNIKDSRYPNNLFLFAKFKPYYLTSVWSRRTSYRLWTRRYPLLYHCCFCSSAWLWVEVLTVQVIVPEASGLSNRSLLIYPPVLDTTTHLPKRRTITVYPESARYSAHAFDTSCLNRAWPLVTATTNTVGDQKG